MKQLAITLVLSVIGFAGNAQKIIEKNIKYNNQEIVLDVKFASNIEVKTWDKSTVYFKADIKTEDNRFIDLYDLDISEGSNKIVIESDAEDVFKATQKDCKKNNTGRKELCYNTGDKYKFNYVLYVPKNAVFEVSSINGDLKSDEIIGEFKADLINGNIDIKTYAGDLDLKTINGVIDLKMIDANMTAETIHGDIYADEKLKLNSKNRYVGHSISGTSGSAINRLRLNTINGNIYLR